jgi:hypothetical protein
MVWNHFADFPLDAPNYYRAWLSISYACDVMTVSGLTITTFPMNPTGSLGIIMVDSKQS